MELKTLLARFASDESGATAIEYGLIIALLVTAIIGGITVLGSETGAAFERTNDQFPI
jgi:pilus assembly protein Flp/PilA